ncbi:MAG TPA: succinate dehydrogenase [Chloroflexota bacterium]|nr:succinate dehydrogenase [Chloroflexota bacterium]
MASSATSPATHVTAAPARAPWWLQPLLVVVVLTGFGIYATWAALQGTGYYVAPYHSPFYSPEVPTITLFGVRISPAIWVLWIPLLFRVSCYYYRKAYYRSFFWDPPACAIRELRREGYQGETSFPWILNNLHRFFLYLALVVLAFLWWDTIRAFNFNGRFGIGLGSLIFLVNVVLLSLYTFSCHSLRHLVGGNVDCYSCVAAGSARYRLWGWVSVLNRRHALYAWLSLFSVLITDIYVRLLYAGVIADPRLL